MNQIEKLVRNYFNAYETKEKEILEELLSQDFTFSSPIDDAIDRNTYFSRCWPSCKEIHEYHIQNLFVDGDEAVVRYECVLKSGASFHNMEHFQFAGNQINEIVVYFGFDLREEPLADMKAKRFNEAFATGDADYIIANITEDVQWHLVGDSELRGREAVTNMFEPMRGIEAKEYKTKNIIAHGNKAVIEGTMKMPKGNGKDQLYAFCDIYTFDPSNTDSIKGLTAYLIELPNGEATNNE